MENKNWEIINWEKSKSIAYFNAVNKATDIVLGTLNDEEVNVRGEMEKDLDYWIDSILKRWEKRNPMPTEKEAVKEVKDY